MNKHMEINKLSNTTPVLLYRGTLIAIIFLSSLLLLFDTSIHSKWLSSNIGIELAVVLYVLLGKYILTRFSSTIANWMLIIFYEFLAFFTMFTWGLNAPIGVLAMCFAVILPSVLMGAKSIFPVSALTISSLILVQFLHEHKIITPNLEPLSQPSTTWDVITYSIILAIFALVSWIASNQREKSLHRALRAEHELRGQKEVLSIELEKESAALRNAQLKQIRELHKFALLGQSAAATLHDLSSHLSVLNMDIEDLQQQSVNSEAIVNAKESIHHINSMVHHARQQLNSYDKTETFNAIEVINQCVKDIKDKCVSRQIKLTRIINRKHLNMTGSPMALMQILSILLNNAVEACSEVERPRITVSLKTNANHFSISIIDNGVGIDASLKTSLFNPMTSTKSSGMGVGLYIAHHLTKNQFEGELKLQPSKHGAHFTITIPKTYSMSLLTP